MVKNILISAITAIVASAIVVAIVLSQVHAPSQDSSQLGGIETIRTVFGGGADVIANTRDGGLVLKGVLSSTTQAVLETIPATTLTGFNTISLTPASSSLTLLLPASTTFPQAFLPRAGDRTSIVLFNATTTTNTTFGSIGIAGGSGTILSVASSTLAANATTTGGNAAMIHILRKPNSDLLFLVTPYKQ